jgi:hypothetical protein
VLAWVWLLPAGLSKPMGARLGWTLNQVGGRISGSRYQIRDLTTQTTGLFTPTLKDAIVLINKLGLSVRTGSSVRDFERQGVRQV